MARTISRPPLVGLVALVVSAVNVPSAESSAGPATERAAAVVASWQMNEPAGSTRMVDSSGRRRHGAISSRAADAGLMSNGSQYKWARRCPSCPPTALPRVVQVPDHADLDIPDPADPWSLRFRFRTFTGEANLMQKGQATTAGGQIKIENPRGFVTCAFLGANGTYVSVRGTKRTNDGKWHVVRCVHTATSVSQWVDGVRVALKSSRTGPIDNSKPFVIGGKTSCNQRTVGCDYFSGRIDWVRITRG